MGRIQAQILASDRTATECGEPRAPGAERRIAGAFNAALLGIMGRRRLVVLAGPATERIEALVRLARHLEVDGALVLPAGGRADAAVEHLIRAAAYVSLPAEQRLLCFDALIDQLANLLETMGTGVLLVDHAERLSAATLSDLIELSGTQSDSGRFLQIVLAGTDALMRRMAEDERDLFSGIAVAVPMTVPAAADAAAVTPAATAAVESAGAAPALPAAAPLLTAAPAGPARQPERVAASATAPASGLVARHNLSQAASAPTLAAAIEPRPDRPRLQAPLPRMRPLAGKPLPVPGAATRRRTLWAASAGVAAVALAVVLAAAPRWVSETASGATHSVADFIDRFRAPRPADADFTQAARTVPAPPLPAAAAPRSATPAPARSVDPSQQPSLPAPAAAPPKPKPPASEQLAAAPPSLKPPAGAERPNLPVEALLMREPPPLDTSAAMPKAKAEPEPAPPREIASATGSGKALPLDRPTLGDAPVLRDTPALRDALPVHRDTDPPADAPRLPPDPAPRDVAVVRADVLRAVPPPPALAGPQSGSTALPTPAPAPGLSGRPGSPAAVTALVTQARRQIDDRHLTTPIGDNALETVRAMEAAAAAGMEPSRLRAAIVDSYLRLGALAEQRGQYPLARVYYRRAQQAIPEHEKIGARLEAIEARLEEIRAETRSEARPGDGPGSAALPSDSPKLR